MKSQPFFFFSFPRFRSMKETTEIFVIYMHDKLLCVAFVLRFD